MVPPSVYNFQNHELDVFLIFLKKILNNTNKLALLKTWITEVFKFPCIVDPKFGFWTFIILLTESFYWIDKFDDSCWSPDILFWFVYIGPYLACYMLTVNSSSIVRNRCN